MKTPGKNFEERVRNRLEKARCFVETIHDASMHQGEERERKATGEEPAAKKKSFRRFSTSGGYDFRVNWLANEIGPGGFRACPFCLSTHLRYSTEDGNPLAFPTAVECEDCGSPGPCGQGATLEESQERARAAWNGPAIAAARSCAIECKTTLGDRFNFSMLTKAERRTLPGFPPWIPALVLVEMRTWHRCFVLSIATILTWEGTRKKSMNLGDLKLYAVELPYDSTKRESRHYYNMRPLLDGDDPPNEAPT